MFDCSQAVERGVEESKGGDGGGGAVGDGTVGATCLTQDQRRCLRWIQHTIVAAPGVPLSPSQLRQLLDVVGRDEVPGQCSASVGCDVS
jgi:hypothetical protein